jgi:hypothetical protein
MKKWNKDDWDNFEKAYVLFPDSPYSNKKIADYMNERSKDSVEIHSNHVSFYKKIFKKNEKKK